MVPISQLYVNRALYRGKQVPAGRFPMATVCASTNIRRHTDAVKGPVVHQTIGQRGPKLVHQSVTIQMANMMHWIETRYDEAAQQLRLWCDPL